MPTRTKPLLRSTATKLGELGLAAPQVVAHRVARMAMAGPILSARDHREFTGMIQEKQLAYVQSWMAMFDEGMRVQQSLLRAWLGSLSPMAALSSRSTRRGPVAHLPDAYLRIASKGLAPVHRKAVANSKRLAKTSVR